MTQIRLVTLTPEAKDKLGRVSTATLTTQLKKHGFRNAFLTGVAPLQAAPRLIGYAVTLRFVPAREDMAARIADPRQSPQRLAVEAVGSEDVLVIEARGEVRGAVLGDILAWRMQVLGAAGIVTDGAIRDTPACGQIEMPIYMQAINANSSHAYHHPADWNIVIGCAGVLIEPGDVIVGDGEGVVALPAHIAESIAHAAYEQEKQEEQVLELVRAGYSTLDIYPPNEKSEAAYNAWRQAA